MLHEIGPPDNLRIEADWPQPEAAPGHVVVRVRAEGVCHRDVIDRRGGFPAMKRPIVPGHEFAGEVAAVGPGVRGIAVGDRVANLLRAPCGECRFCQAGQEPRCERSAYAFGLTADGGYAEYVSAPWRALVPLPDAIPFEHACFLACTAGVALRALRDRAGLRAGETLLVTGASGGVGQHAIQVGRALGARVIAVTSSEAKAEALGARGADEAIVSRDLAFHKEVRRRTGGVDVALDCVGVPTLNASLRSLRPLGRLAMVGNVTASRFDLNPGLVILGQLAIVGSAGCSRDDLRTVFDWVRDGKVEPALSQVLPLEAAAEAHQRLEARGVTGRLVLRP